MKILSYSFLIFVLIFSCKNGNITHSDSINNNLDSLKKKQNTEIQENTSSPKISKNHELLNYSKVCDCGKGNLTVNTKYYNIADTLNSYKYIIISQELIFKIDQRIVKTIHPPYKEMKRVINNETMNVPVTDVYSVKCIQKDNEFIYSIYGGNIYDPPHEFFSLNNLNGEWLSYFYGDRYDTYDSFGDYELYVKKFGEQVNKLDDMIEVIPNPL